MIKFIFKWLLRLFFLAVVLGVVFLLSLDSIVRLVAEHNIRAQTGMEAEIGRFHVGLLKPVLHIEDLRLYNPPEFGGTPFLKIPEIHVEYDRAALAKSQIHITLLRFNLGELDIVKNAAGKTNLFALGLALPTKSATTSATKAATAELRQRTGLEFQQIEVLNVSIGTLKYIDLKDQRNNRAQKIDIENKVLPKPVKTLADLTGLEMLIALRSDDFFGSLLPGMK